MITEDDLYERIKTLEYEKIELQEENEKLKIEKDTLLKTTEAYRTKIKKISDYIKQNCEIIRHKDYDEIGKVNGGHILYIIEGDEK